VRILGIASSYAQRRLMSLPGLCGRGSPSRTAIQRRINRCE
jgi:hypothetical protein